MVFKHPAPVLDSNTFTMLPCCFTAP